LLRAPSYLAAARVPSELYMTAFPSVGADEPFPFSAAFLQDRFEDWQSTTHSQLPRPYERPTSSHSKPRKHLTPVQRRGVGVTAISTIAIQPPMIADELRRQADFFIDLRVADKDRTRSFGSFSIAQSLGAVETSGKSYGHQQLRPCSYGVRISFTTFCQAVPGSGQEIW
jgi:hypothetical protein